MALAKFGLKFKTKDPKINMVFEGMRTAINQLVDSANKAPSKDELVKIGSEGIPDYLSTDHFQRTQAGHIKIKQHPLQHGMLSGLNDDDHTQYALLIGRSGGQTLIGGTAANDDLELQTTSDATKGDFIFRHGTIKLYDTDNSNYLGFIVPDISGDVTWTLPMVEGNANDFLQTDGAGTLIFAAAPGATQYFFKTITGITNDVVADAIDDTLTLTSANDRLTIVGTTATDTITWTLVEANIDHGSIAGLDDADHNAVYYTETEVNTWRNSVTQTEMGYVNGVSSDIQTQLNGKEATVSWANLTVGGVPLTITGGTNAVDVATAITFNYDTTDLGVSGNNLYVKDAGIDHDSTTNTHNLSTDIDHSGISNISYATAGHTGFEPTVTKGNLTETTSSVLSITSGTGAVIGSGTTIQVTLAATGTDGYLSGADWDTFNSKQAGNAVLTELTALTDPGADKIAVWDESVDNFVWLTLADELSIDATPTLSVDHDLCTNFASNEHFTQANITATGTIASGTWQGTSIGVTWTDAKCTDALADQTSANETSHATVVVDADFGSAGLCATNGSGTYSIIADASGNWNTAHGWGDHASGGYAASGGAEHDGFSDFVANEHIDWTGASSNFSTTGTLTIANANAYIGVDDTTSGSLSLYGHATGSGEGGEIKLHLAADFDTTIDYYSIDIYQDDIRIFPNTAAWIHYFRNTGAVEFAGSIASTTLNLTGGQIAFPASQSASADVNTLDDYEEGTWTPTKNGFTEAGGGSYTLTGRYTKVGRLVFASGIIQCAGGATIAGVGGTSVISGLPFAGTTGIGFPALWMNGNTLVSYGVGQLYEVSLYATTFGATAANDGVRFSMVYEV